MLIVPDLPFIIEIIAKKLFYGRFLAQVERHQGSRQVEPVTHDPFA
jgi:hypothetical protein